MNLQEDFLAFGGVMVERLRAMLPDTVFVLSAKDLSGVKETAQQAPAVHVIYRDFEPAKGVNGAWSGVEQRWLTVVVVRNVVSMATADAPLADAGPLLAKVITAFTPWVPADAAPDFQGIHLKASPPVGYTRAGFAYFPIVWGVDLRIRRGR